MDSNTRLLRVLVVDDHPAVLQGLKCLLEPEGITVCAEAGNCAGALAAAEAHHPDIALVDISLGEEDGITLIAALGERALPSIAYSIHQDGGHVKRAFAVGALGYVTKSEVRQVLVQAIFEVAEGRRFVSPRAAMALAEQDAQSST